MNKDYGPLSSSVHEKPGTLGTKHFIWIETLACGKLFFKIPLAIDVITIHIFMY